MGFIQNLGPLQLVLIVVVILVLFGVGKLPQVGKGVGQAINEFKDKYKVNGSAVFCDDSSSKTSGISKREERK